MALGSLLVALLAGVAAAVPTANIEPRQVPTGTVIYRCTKPGTVALTFDDGPFIYTTQVLNSLKAAGMKATFFINGQNWGSIWDHQATVRRMVSDGHQVGSHTWAHPNLAGLSASAVTTQMTQLESALLTILGKFPTYMRPPYFSYSPATLQTLGGLGYKVIQCDVDTFDWQYNTPAAIGQSLQLFDAGLNGGGSIVLAHDVHQTTAGTLVNGMIASIKRRGLKAVTVGECLGDAPANWYRTSRGGTPPTNPPTNPPTGTVTPDGTCGGTKKYRCPTGEYKCCSQWGWCGDTAEHCAAGCNKSFGVCW